MIKIIIALFMTLNVQSFANDSLLCNMFLKYHTTFANHGLRIKDKISAFISPEKPGCVKESSNFYESLIEALIENDKEATKFLIEKVSSDSRVKMINKIMKADGAESLEKFIQENQGNFNRLSDTEKAIVKEHPYRALIVLYMYNFAEKKAEEQSEESFSSKTFQDSHGSSYQGTKDAYRHMMINAMAARFGMEEITLKMGIAHEASSGPVKLSHYQKQNFDQKLFDKHFPVNYKEYRKCNPAMPVKKLQSILHKRVLAKFTDNSMDLHNNMRGVLIGSNHQCANIDEISELVIKEIEKGKAKIVSEDPVSCIQSLVSSNDFTRKSPGEARACRDHNELIEARRAGEESEERITCDGGLKQEGNRSSNTQIVHEGTQNKRSKKKNLKRKKKGLQMLSGQSGQQIADRQPAFSSFIHIEPSSEEKIIGPTQDPTQVSPAEVQRGQQHDRKATNNNKYF